MAPDTKVPDGRTERRTDGQHQINIPPPMFPAPWGPRFSTDHNHFQTQAKISLEQNVPTKFHEDWTNCVTSTMKTSKPPGGHIKNVTSTVLTRFNYIIRINILTKFQFNIIGTNLLTKFHEDRAINVAATVLTRKIFMTQNGRQTIDKRLSQKFTLSKKYYAHKDCHHGVVSIVVCQGEVRGGYRGRVRGRGAGRGLSSDNHLVDGPTDIPTDRPT
ncbi:hypothetical protein DPMN_039358 [Dreissena polymorpha]|uniref:Uncharacterized protein n=1 Tax=Dreissena polymorpha TaxID=45954 RepID=A0A9D4MFU5_DREPO|nr:hypothetical protein DPMN_039358 [Dreissena polymorpha]